MASSKEYLTFILEQLCELDDITYRSMMGEYILYYRGRIFGGIYDDRLLVKSVAASLAMFDEPIHELPYDGGREMLLIEDVENREFLAELVIAMYDELPQACKRR